MNPVKPLSADNGKIGTRKGQTINIDWSIGLALFLVTILSSVLFIIDPLTVQNSRSLENKAMDVQETLQREAGREVTRNTFYIRSQETIENVPFDREYFYRNSLGTGVASKPSLIDIQDDRFAAVLSTGNSSVDLSYFRGGYEMPTYYSDLSLTSSQISNDRITLSYSSNIDSADIKGREAIQSLTLDGDPDETFEDEVVVESFSGNLKVFNDSSEFIVEDGSFELRTRNYSTLYWHPDGNESLAGSDTTFKQGETSGFTLADSDLGVTFLGDMNANVSKPDSSTVLVEVDAPRTRIRLHESGTGYGEKRIESYIDREAFFGTEDIQSSFFRTDLDAVSEMEEREFETEFDLVNWGYNISITPETRDIETTLAQRVSKLQDWNQGSYSGTSASRKANSGDLGIGYRNGSADTDLTEGLVGYWRMDQEVSGDGGTVRDYSGYGNDGTTSGGVRTGEDGIFGASSANFGGSSISTDTISANGTVKTVSFWVKTPNSGGSWSTLLQWDVENDAGTQSARTELDGGGERIYTRWIVDESVEGYSTDDGGVWSRPGSYDYDDGDWHLYTSTFDGDKIVEYWDGEEFSTTTGVGSEVANFSEGSDVNIYSAGISPNLDEVRIYNRSLSEEEVQKLYFNGQDGAFEGGYRADRIDYESEKNWYRLNVDASVPAETDLEAEFQALDSSGNPVDSVTRSISDGDNSYQVDPEASEGARVILNGTSTDPTVSWEVDSLSVEHTGSRETGPLLSKGQQIAFQDTATSTRQFSFMTSEGEMKRAESRVILWR